MFEVIGVSDGIIKKAKAVQIRDFIATPKTIYATCIWIDKDGRHEHDVSWDKSINPVVNLKDAIWCECTICSSFNIKNKEWCRCKTRFAQELIKRGFWPQEVERYIYGDNYGGEK